MKKILIITITRHVRHTGRDNILILFLPWVCKDFFRLYDELPARPEDRNKKYPFRVAGNEKRGGSGRRQ